MYSLDEIFHEETEVISFFSFEKEAMNCSLFILDTNVDGSSFAIQETGDGFK